MEISIQHVSRGKIAFIKKLRLFCPIQEELTDEEASKYFKRPVCANGNVIESYFDL